MPWSFARNQRGNVVIVFGLTAPALIGMAGAAVDYSRLADRRTELQRVADAAALSAAKVLSTNYAQTSGQREAAAVLAANQVTHGAAPTAQSTATVFLTEKSAQVSMSETLNLAFGGLLGQSTSQVGVLAKAKYTSPPGCIVALNTAAVPGIAVEGSARIQAQNCSVWSNATSATSSITVASAASITAGSVCAVGGGSGTVKPKLDKNCEPALDPFAGRALSASTGCTYSNKVVNSNETLLPGVYCGGLTVKGNNTATFSPGLYTIRTGPLHFQGSPTINGNGVSFLLGSGAYLDLQGNPMVKVSAMTTGALAGLVIASDPAAPAQSSSIQGNVSLVLTANLTGSIYLPNHALSVGGSSDLIQDGAKDALVVGSLQVAGSSKVGSAGAYPIAPTVALTQ